MTKLQTTILDILYQTTEHLTAEQVFFRLKELMPSISLSTVYRNLNQFAEQKRIRRIQQAHKADYYEKNLIPHDHICCIRCGRITDLNVKGLSDFLQKNCDVPIISFDLTVNYLCHACASNLLETTQRKELS